VTLTKDLFTSVFQPKPDQRDSPVVVLIPVYQPGRQLIKIVRALDARSVRVVVVDDGSGPDYTSIFDEIAASPNVDLLSHAINLGKGSALKTGMNAILCAYPDAIGIVTADADGQHDPADVLMLCERLRDSPDALVLGVREFGRNVPPRSRLGNRLSCRLTRGVLGNSLSDTQTGLRSIPKALLPALLKSQASGYEFELEMLIAAKHLGVLVSEQRIRTIYEAGNPTSHFRPFRDSIRICYALLRFGLIGLASAVLDHVAFYLLFGATASVPAALAAARLISMDFNYSAVKNAVFLSDESHRNLLPRYLLLVAANAALSYTGIQFVTSTALMGAVPAKILVETVLFAANFIIQRDFIFTRRARARHALAA
jgi:putative flippase GtrA